MLADILDTFCIEVGYDKVAQRDVALKYINRAAFRLYQAIEADAMMREVVLSVSRNMQVSLPSFMGELRGMRETFNNGGNFESAGITIPLFEIGVPRYTSDSSKFRWRNWTKKNVSPISQTSTLAGPLTFISAFVENPPAVINVVGGTTNSQVATESIVMTQQIVSTNNSYDTNALKSISSTSTRLYDISIQDLNGLELAKLYNGETHTRYGIIDVSSYPWITSGGNGVSILAEVLYKARFYKFINDTDEFPAEGYDEAIASKALSLTFGTQDGKEQNALEYESDAQSLVDLQTSNAEVGTQRRIEHGPNAVYKAFTRIKRNSFRRQFFGTDYGYWQW